MPKKVVGILTEYLVDNFDEACIGIDKEGRIHFFNRSAAALFGIQGRSVIGQKIWDALEMSDFTRAFVRVVKSGDTSAREQIVVMPDQRALQTQLFPVRGSEGRLVGSVAVIRDVTSIQRIEKDVTTLVARISEEMKIPLTSIKGYVETLLEGAYTEPPILRKFLQIINDETNRMARLLVGLMDAGEARRPGEAPLEPVALAPLVREVASSLSPLAQQKRLKLEIDVSESLPRVSANPALLRQALTNLVDNAIKIAGLNSQLPEKADAPGLVSVRGRLDGERVVLEIRDNGVGIPPDQVERIFERFHRVTEGPAAQLGGTGLGLSIAREIVEACGGGIDVQSTLGRGSTFLVRLKRPPEAPAVRQSPRK